MKVDKKDKILVVDDMAINLELIKSVLGKDGKYSLVTVTDGVSAIRKAKTNNFDLILLDIMMPGMDGYEVCKILKSYPTTKDIPIIFLTALNDPKNIQKAFQFGAVDYISKPFSKEELTARVNLHISLKHTTEELIKAKRAAESAAEAKAIFLANMSHELRTPMNGIIGMVDILKRTPLTDAQREYLSIIESSGENLLTIINDILDLSKIEAGHMELENIPFSLKEELTRVMNILQVIADKKKLPLVLKIADGVPPYVSGDPVRLKQIIINLVNNAIKFTDKGSVTVSVEKKGVEDGKVQLLFKVMDTGIGISPEGQKKLFQSFSQVDKSTTRKYGGTGLGLMISKNLTHMMGGEIGVESVEGVGSTFWFYVYLDVSDEESYKKQNETEQQSDLTKKRIQLKLHILLAEDNKINQKVATLNLNNLGHDVDVANNGKEAVEMFKNGNYDIIFMDVHMPEMDGVEACKKIREIEKKENRIKKIPIIAMTANTSEDERKKYLEAGMDGYVAKPFKQKELIEIFTQFAV
ncbi:response regulator [Candidatus Sulfidibacterium hydrothermale]|uniref:response regulator n=1 Tax=Candidatus Sulfidibacterium hydrothermale TaxID=2875962 RepID=UPI001F0B4697|nr:response regulator [Candidatus Sulfidibacterium hydrothermale]UBM61871.1 response regulator [Candidatus Sulfidibacterium hydrothermale]